MSRRWLALPAVLLMVAGGSLYSWWQSPSSTTQVHSPQPASEVLGSQTSLQSWQTAYFSTRYPTSLRILTTTENTSRTIIGNYLLTSANPQYNDQAGVTVGTLGDGTFAEISAIKYRGQHPELFEVSSRAYAPSGAVVFNGLQAYETDIIWQHDSRYAIVAVTGSSARHAELEQTAAAIVSNWQWQ